MMIQGKTTRRVLIILGLLGLLYITAYWNEQKRADSLYRSQPKNWTEKIAALDCNLEEHLKVRCWNPLPKPEGIDLDVVYISRSPMYSRYQVSYTEEGKPYLDSGTENDRRWPKEGETVTFSAHIINKGTVESGSFTYTWYVDGEEVSSGMHIGLTPGEKASPSYQWQWAHKLDGERLLGSHTIRFSADPDGVIEETYETNNSLTDRTDAISLRFIITPEIYTALETAINPKWPYSAEDWLQKQISALNIAMEESVYPTTPNGILERVRLDRVVISPASPPNNYSEDGEFLVSVDHRFRDKYYDPENDVSGYILHELAHALGVIDIYQLDTPAEVLEVVDRNGQALQMEFSASDVYPGIMTRPAIQPKVFEEHTALGLNSNKGYRRGYYGEYLYDVPQKTFVQVFDSDGNPAQGVVVRFFQRVIEATLKGSKQKKIDTLPEFSGFTDQNGMMELPNRSVFDNQTTATGHTLRNNPFAILDVVGMNGVFLVELSKGEHQEYLWLDITRFNLERWNGDGIIQLYSQVPNALAPSIPIQLRGALEGGFVRLAWLPEVDKEENRYLVYRATSPDFVFERVFSRVKRYSFVEPAPLGSRVSIYAVRVADADGNLGNFSNFFYAFDVRKPVAIVVKENGERIVLDPKNGYALLAQTSDGRYTEPLASINTHLEHSQFMALSADGDLFITHPGDFYTARDSVRVFDEALKLQVEFGETGSGAGQFRDPAGIAIWEEPMAPKERRILVVDSGNHRIQVFDEQGRFISAFGSMGILGGHFRDPRGITIDRYGNVIVADSGNNRLVFLRFDGEKLAYVKQLRHGFDQPNDVRTFGDEIIVADTGNDRIVVITHQGHKIAQIDRSADADALRFSGPRGIAVDSNGNILVADTGNGRIVVIPRAWGDAD